MCAPWARWRSADAARERGRRADDEGRIARTATRAVTTRLHATYGPVMRWVFTSFVLFACDARFSDLRPEEASLDSGTNVVDAARLPVDAGIDTSQDASRDPVDAATDDAAIEDATTPATVVATGTFEGRGGYDASGRVTLEHLGGDRYALLTGDDFATAAVPSPVLLVSDRDALGSRLQPSDVRVATLSAAQLRGAQRFEVTLTSVPAYAWVYCEPFGVETARARLEAR